MVAGHARRVAARLSSETPAGHGQNSRDRACSKVKQLFCEIVCTSECVSLVFYIIEFLLHVLSVGSEHPTHRGKGELYGAGTTTSPVSSKQ